MLNPSLRCSAALALTLAMVVSVSAQQGTPGGDAGGGGEIVTGGQAGTGAGTQSGNVEGAEPGAFATLDADSVFAGIDRGDTVGSTGSTGTGFSDVGGATGARGTGGFGGFGGGGGLGGLGSLFGFGGGNAGSQSTRPPIRTRLRSAINVPLTPPQVVQQVASRRLQTLPYQARMPGVNVTMQGKTAVISGVVSSERERRMSELLMRLEPGVRSVDNRVVVVPQ